MYSVEHGGRGGLGYVENIFMTNTLCIWPGSNKIALPPQTKTSEGRGLR